jgi:hypothetical protein
MPLQRFRHSTDLKASVPLPTTLANVMLARQPQAHPFIVKPKSREPHNRGPMQCLYRCDLLDDPRRLTDGLAAPYTGGVSEISREAREFWQRLTLGLRAITAFMRAIVQPH